MADRNDPLPPVGVGSFSDQAEAENWLSEHQGTGDGDESGIRVTVTDLATGEVETTEIWNDYLVVTAGSCRITNVQDYPTSGTHVVTVKGVNGKKATNER